MSYFFMSWKVYRNYCPCGIGTSVVICSCGLARIKEVILDDFNSKHEGKCRADNIMFTSLTVLDPLTAAQLTDNYTDYVFRIEDGNSAE